MPILRENYLNTKPVFIDGHDSKWSHPDWTSKCQNILSLFTGNMVDTLLCQIRLSTLGLSEVRARQKMKSQYLKLQCANGTIWCFQLKITLKTLTSTNSQFPDETLRKSIILCNVCYLYFYFEGKNMKTWLKCPPHKRNTELRSR